MTKPFDPLFQNTAARPVAESFIIESKPLDPLVLKQEHRQEVAAKKVEAYTHIDAYTCPARGCGQPMTQAMLSSHEVVSYCEKHRIAFPQPL